MTDKEIFELVIKFIEALAVWPIFIFLIVLFLRKEIKFLLREAFSRIRSVEIGENKFEFSEAEKAAFKYSLEDLIDFIDNNENNPSLLRNTIETMNKKVDASHFYVSNLTYKALLNKRILWVDDNPNNNIYESSVLKAFGAEVKFALATDQAIQAIQKYHPDIVISDVYREEAGHENSNAGYELLDELSNLFGARLPLIFYAGDVSYINQSRARLAYGLADNPDMLFQLVVKALKVGLK